VNEQNINKKLHFLTLNISATDTFQARGTLSGSKAETNDDTASTSRSKSIQPNNLDLSFDKSNVDDQQKLFLLKNKWVIPSSFVFPLTDIRGTKRRFNRSWLEKYKWLRYSESDNGVFCLCCVLFNSSEHVFVKNSVNDWVNLGTLIKRHFGQPGHSGYVEMSENFMSIVEGQKDDVISMLSSDFQDKITRNRSILHSILKTIYICGKQNIPLRGHTEEKSNFITPAVSRLTQVAFY
jgi:hypothetical protein